MVKPVKVNQIAISNKRTLILSNFPETHSYGDGTKGHPLVYSDKFIFFKEFVAEALIQAYTMCSGSTCFWFDANVIEIKIGSEIILNLARVYYLRRYFRESFPVEPPDTFEEFPLGTIPGVGNVCFTLRNVTYA